GKVFQFARTSRREVVTAIDPASGKSIWQAGYSAPYQVNSAASAHGPGPKSTPLVAAGKVYTFGIGGVLSCHDSATGKVLWAYESATQWKTSSPTYGAAMSPLLTGGAVIAHIGTDNNGALTAFDAATGKIRWQWKGDGPAYASPVVLQ